MLKKVAIGLGVLVLLGAGVLGWLWHQATALPAWYTEGDAQGYAGGPESAEGPAPAPGWVVVDEQGERVADAEVVPLVPQAPAPEEVERRQAATPSVSAPRRTRSADRGAPQRHELRGFHVRRTKDGKRKSNPAIKASRAVYDDGELEIGVILDLAEMPTEKLKPKDRARYDRAIRNFPGITQRDVWVGVEDEPISVGGYLQLSPQAEVRVGKLTYSLGSAAKRMGMSPMELRMELNRELRRLGFVDPEA